MSAPVQLYVYDLSNGMASQLSRQLTGRQIDGIWHTSVVVFGREVFYGQGIMTAAPGRSHHGTPLRVIDMGETSLDEATWNEYLDDMREHYTADKYHLLDFNCNSFTNDCIGFLTGGAIPDFIKDLPADFLSTPFGAALRPTIDAMFRAPSASSTPTPAPRIPETQPVRPDPNPQLTASLLQAIANQAALPELPPPFTPPTSTSNPTAATQSLTGPIHLATNPASFHTLLRTHRAVVAFFTQQSCPPCRVIEPVFERLALDTTNNITTNRKGGLAFTKIDIGVGLGSALAQEFSVRATPTFIFFLDGQKIAEIKGADAGELKTQVDLLVWGAWPPHPHVSLSTRALSFSLAPILFTQQPPLDALATKFTAFIDAYCDAASADSALALKIPIDPSMLTAFTSATEVLVGALKVEELFPLADMWRLAFLDPSVGQFFATQSSQTPNPIEIFLAKLPNSNNSNDAPPSPSMSRNYTLVLLRLLANAFSSPEFALLMMKSRRLKDAWTPLLVGALLHADAGVRTAAASLAFNAGAYGLNRRLNPPSTNSNSSAEEDGDGEWEVEMASALVEAIDREAANEDVVHRLVAALASLLRLSPFHEQLGGLLEVLQAKEVLKRKLATGNFGAGGKGGVKKEEVRALIRDVADKLCT
ncbi:hypothetical protein PLEOSDRAFT_1057725 [Pleurotus ostreatus PC15]|uniref:PPPDE domain-containing protein n=1 Tax=Pleurotus ostreatus (strain PC15) TaxID=1137138 RepID=A0A067NC68_PLEO1|nr:hypothetical protein PLEOSDRAFT_1057725 [Pleurotus ostreatus PC15]